MQSAPQNVNDPRTRSRARPRGLGRRVLQRRVWLAVTLTAAACIGSATNEPDAQGDIGALRVWPRTASVGLGQSLQFFAYGLITERDSVVAQVSWEASGGTVSPTGVFTAADTGEFAVTATHAQKLWLTDEAVVDVGLVAPGVAQLVVVPQNATIALGDSVDVFAVGLTAAGDTLPVQVTWMATGGAILQQGPSQARYHPDQTGVHTVAARVGIIESGGDLEATTTVTVVPAPVASVSVSPASFTVSVGQSVGLTATVRDAAGNVLTGRTIVWSTSAPGVATVNGSGVVQSQGTGSATITATSEGQSGTAQVTVTSVPVASVTMSPTVLNLVVAQTGQLTATPRDAGGTPLTGRAVVWSTNAPGVATVNGSGLVTAQGPGSATITATSEGQSASASVTVTLAPVASVTVTPSSPNVSLGGTRQLTATLRDAAGNVLTGRPIVWSTSASGVATVNGSGLVTAQGTGTATITATSEGQSGRASCRERV